MTVTIDPTAGPTAPLLATRLSLPHNGTEAWVVVDSLVDGMAMGGTRMTTTVDEAEVAGLARAMTTKLALVGLRIGGAKAGIRMPTAPTVDRLSLLREFGRVSAPLLHGGVYLGSDLGCTHADRDRFFAAAGYDILARPGVRAVTSDWTELWRHMVTITGDGVGVAVEGALRGANRDGSQRVVIQGFGAVGRAAAAFLSVRGHRIVAVADIAGTVRRAGGLPVDALLAATSTNGTIDRSRLPDDVRISGADTEQWLDTDADVLILAAGGSAIHAENVHRVCAAFVVEGANLASTPSARAVMKGAGVRVLPDVVVNVGGAAVTGCVLSGAAPPHLGVTELCDWLQTWVCTRIEENCEALTELVDGGSPDPVAELLAARRT